MQILPFFQYSLYQMFLIFCFWSFVGWCIEVVDMTYETGEYQNRGFLNMPICPIYGAGVLMIVIFFRPIQNMSVPLFFASLILCTAFEFFIGWGMEKIFHARWWDYSHMKFNIKGYICLRNSLFFGFGCVIVVRYIQPALENAISAIPIKIGLAFVVIMSILIIIDTIASVLAVRKLNDKIRRLDEISRLMLSFSVKTGKTLASGTLKIKSNVNKIIDAKDTIVEKAQDKSAENIEKLKKEYEQLISERDAATDRIVKAFPRLHSHRYSESLQLIKDKISGKLSKSFIAAEGEKNADAVDENPNENSSAE